MHILSYLGQSFKSVWGPLWAFASVVIVFVPVGDTTNLLHIEYRYVIAIILFMLLIISVLVSSIFRIIREHFSNVRILHCLMESNQYIMFIKNSPAFYMDAIVTIFKTEERDEISSNKKIKYERPFAVGFVKLIQDDGLIQIEIMDFVEECSNDEREGLNRCDPNIIKRLSVRPFMHMKYLEVINK